MRRFTWAPSPEPDPDQIRWPLRFFVGGLAGALAMAVIFLAGALFAELLVIGSLIAGAIWP